MTLEEAVGIVRTQTIPALGRSGGGGHVEALEAVLAALDGAQRELAAIRELISHDPATCPICRGRA